MSVRPEQKDQEAPRQYDAGGSEVDSHPTPTPPPPSGKLDDQRRELVCNYLGLAQRLAFRYSGRGQPPDELLQVASLGLVKAAARFDPTRGNGFGAFAAPTILGELRRHFRDHCWAVHLPRPIHDLYQAAEKAREPLIARLGREPTAKELSEDLGRTTEDVLAALEAGHAYRAISLDAPTPDHSESGESGDAYLEDAIGETDDRLDRVEKSVSIRGLVGALPARQKHVIAEYYFGGKTQKYIGAELGVSQMQISRLLSAGIKTVRRRLAEPGVPASRPAESASRCDSSRHRPSRASLAIQGKRANRAGRADRIGSRLRHGLAPRRLSATTIHGRPSRFGSS